jgi:hypothetical protein
VIPSCSVSSRYHPSGCWLMIPSCSVSSQYNPSGCWLVISFCRMLAHLQSCKV